MAEVTVEIGAKVKAQEINALAIEFGRTFAEEFRKRAVIDWDADTAEDD